MGLDIWMGEIKRPSDDMVEFMSKRFVHQSPSYIRTLDTDTDMSDAVRDLCVKVKSYAHNWDYDLIETDFHVPEGYREYRYSSSSQGIELGYAPSYETDKPESITISISNYDLEHRYSIVEPIEILLLEWHDLYYWRKRYDIQKLAYSCRDVENCGFYDMDPDIVKQMMALSPDWSDEFDSNIVYAYHEWY